MSIIVKVAALLGCPNLIECSQEILDAFVSTWGNIVTPSSTGKSSSVMLRFAGVVIWTWRSGDPRQIIFNPFLTLRKQNGNRWSLSVSGTDDGGFPVKIMEETPFETPFVKRGVLAPIEGRKISEAIVVWKKGDKDCAKAWSNLTGSQIIDEEEKEVGSERKVPANF